MRHAILLGATILVAGAALPDAGNAQKPRVAVLVFENNTSQSVFGDRLGSAAADELTTQLVKTGEFSVIERQQIDAVLAEQTAGLSGVIDPATAAQVGRILGAQLVIVGSITRFSLDRKSGGIRGFSATITEGESSIDVRAINTTTAEIMVVAEGEGTKRMGGASYRDINIERDFDAGVAQEALRPAVEDAVEQLLEQKDTFAALVASVPMGEVVGSRDASFYIDRGQNAGIEVGQRFEVVRVIDTITDAAGNVLDEITEKVGVLQVTTVLSQSSVCDLVEGEAREGDKLRAISESGG